MVFVLFIIFKMELAYYYINEVNSAIASNNLEKIVETYNNLYDNYNGSKEYIWKIHYINFENVGECDMESNVCIPTSYKEDIKTQQTVKNYVQGIITFLDKQNLKSLQNASNMIKQLMNTYVDRYTTWSKIKQAPLLTKRVKLVKKWIKNEVIYPDVMKSLLNRTEEFNNNIINYILQTLRRGSVANRMEVLGNEFNTIRDTQMEYIEIKYISFRQIESALERPRDIIWIPVPFKNNAEVQSLLADFDYYTYTELQLKWKVFYDVYKDINVDNLTIVVVPLMSYVPIVKQIRDLFIECYSKIFNDNEKEALNDIKRDIVKAIKRMCKGKTKSINTSLLQKLKDFIDKNGKFVSDFDFSEGFFSNM